VSVRHTPLRIRRILVAIGDVRHAPRSQLRKAATLARALRASVELFHSINEPIAMDLMRGRGDGKATVSGAWDLVEQRSQKLLERLAGESIFRGVQVRAATSWDYPAHEAIVRRVLATRADLVVAATRAHRQAARLFLTNTDWELIRQCPCPVLLTKSPHDYRKPAVIAAVDPFHAHAKPARLDERILRAGAALADRLGGELHIFHAYLPLTIIAPAPAGQPLAITLPPEFEDVHGQRVARVFDALAGKARIPPARRHLHMGDVSGEIEQVVKRTKADIVVMGAVSRSRLRRIFIGSTAEAVIDRLNCDLLVVKPQGFATTVPKRSGTAPHRGRTP
jgi:universal stress protein E